MKEYFRYPDWASLTDAVQYHIPDTPFLFGILPLRRRYNQRILLAKSREKERKKMLAIFKRKTREEKAYNLGKRTKK